MKQCLSERPIGNKPSEFSHSGIVQTILGDLLAEPIDSEDFLTLSNQFLIDTYQVGDLIWNQSALNFQALSVADDTNGNNDSTQNNAQETTEHIENFLSLVCQGRVRLLCFDAQQQRSVSVKVLVAGNTFGADCLGCQQPLPYQAIAASPCQVARIAFSDLQVWLSRWPRFQDALVQEIQNREHLIFFKNDVFSSPPEESPGKPMLMLPPIQGEVRFEDASFSYDPSDDRHILQNLSFEVQAGQTIAIVGRSGSGKTTLVKLLQGFYQPSRGRILVDDHDIRHDRRHRCDLNWGWCRRSVSCFPALFWKTSKSSVPNSAWIR